MGLERALLLLAGAMSACTLFTSFDDLSGEPEADTGAEGGVDAGLTAEAGDGADGADSAAPGFCASQADAAACEDFDEKPLPGVFDAQFVQGGILGLASDDFVSAPFALSAELGAEVDPKKEHIAQLGLAIPLAMRAVLETKVRVTKAPTATRYAHIAGLGFFGATSSEELYFVEVRVAGDANGIGLQLTEYTVPTDTFNVLTLPQPVALEEWTTIRLAIDVTKSLAELYRVSNGAEALIGTSPLSLPSLTSAKQTVGYVGLYANGAQEGWAARFDDFVLRAP